MAISILVCDDLQEERTGLIRMLRDYESRHGTELDMETASDGTEMVSMWKPERWDLIFLDIYMPQMNGVDAARQLRKAGAACEIVFVTTSREHGMEGYELHAMDYLTKPYTQEHVDSVMDWFLQQRAEKRQEILIRTQAGEETIRIRDICYIESRGHVCIIRTAGQTVSTRRSIDALASEMDTSFFRCHKSFLLNFAHVRGIERNTFLMDDGSSVPISAANLSRSKTALLAWKTGMP